MFFSAGPDCKVADVDGPPLYYGVLPALFASYAARFGRRAMAPFHGDWRMAIDGPLMVARYAASMDAVAGVLDLGLAAVATLVLVAWSMRRRGRHRSSRD